MDSETNQPEILAKPQVSSSSSCRKKVKDDNATFFANFKDHIDEFIHSSMDEHKNCFKDTMNKIFGMPMALSVAEKQAEVKEVVEIHSPKEVLLQRSKQQKQAEVREMVEIHSPVQETVTK